MRPPAPTPIDLELADLDDLEALIAECEAKAEYHGRRARRWLSLAFLFVFAAGFVLGTAF